MLERQKATKKFKVKKKTRVVEYEKCSPPAPEKHQITRLCFAYYYVKCVTFNLWIRSVSLVFFNSWKIIYFMHWFKQPLIPWVQSIDLASKQVWEWSVFKVPNNFCLQIATRSKLYHDREAQDENQTEKRRRNRETERRAGVNHSCV